jgi:glycerol-3-phosphate acyltransferase PlsX
LNIGTEDRKGTDLVRETRGLYSKSQLNFTGHIEGNNLFNGSCDVIVCEGFVGNVVLKVAEGLSESFFKRLGDDLRAANASEQAVVGRFLSRFQAEHDYAEYGAAPLLGVNGICMISHGRSDARAIKNALKVTRKLVQNRLREHILEGLEKCPDE